MRVAFDVTIPARTVTGVGVYARQLLLRLQRGPVDVVAWQHLLTPSGRAWARLTNALCLLAWLELEVARRVRREGVAVYHSATSIGPLRAGCPTVMTVHDATLLMKPSQYGRVDRLYHRVFSVLAARRAAAVIVPSRAAREAVGRTYRISPERIHVVPHGVAPTFRTLPEPAWRTALERHGVRRPYMLFVGAEVPRKNLARLITAYAQLCRREPSRGLGLVLVGPPESTDASLDRLVARLGVDGRVRRLGLIHEDDLPLLYNGAACLAYPSLAEGFGLPILEAMACGTPVLTSNRSSMAEVAGDAALLVDPERVDAIVDGLRQLMEDGALAADLVARGRVRATGFTWERTAVVTEGVYRLVAGAGGGPGRPPPHAGYSNLRGL